MAKKKQSKVETIRLLPNREVRLSEAIRLGIQLDGPQIYGHLVGFAWNKDNPEEPPVIGTCALGAACVGWGLMEVPAVATLDMDGYYQDPSDPEFEAFLEQLPAHVAAPLSNHVNCPADGEVRHSGLICRGDRDTIYGMVIHLNDSHHWTREAIAEWLDGIGV